MEAKYIALSQSTIDLITIRKILKEINEIILNEIKSSTFHAHTKIFNLPQSTMFEGNQGCLKFATMSKISQ